MFIIFTVFFFAVSSPCRISSSVFCWLSIFWSGSFTVLCMTEDVPRWAAASRTSVSRRICLKTFHKYLFRAVGKKHFFPMIFPLVAEDFGTVLNCGSSSLWNGPDAWAGGRKLAVCDAAFTRISCMLNVFRLTRDFSCLQIVLEWFSVFIREE